MARDRNSRPRASGPRTKTGWARARRPSPGRRRSRRIMRRRSLCSTRAAMRAPRRGWRYSCDQVRGRASLGRVAAARVQLLGMLRAEAARGLREGGCWSRVEAAPGLREGVLELSRKYLSDGLRGGVQGGALAIGKCRSAATVTLRRLRSRSTACGLALRYGMPRVVQCLCRA